MTATQVAYLAGQIDADGTICLTGAGSRSTGQVDYIQAVCTLFSQDLDMLLWAQSLFGGKIWDSHPGVLVWRPQPVVDFVKAIRPYLHTKATQADLLLEYKERTSGYRQPGYVLLTAEERGEFAKRSRELNARLPKETRRRKAS